MDVSVSWRVGGLEGCKRGREGGLGVRDLDDLC